jgi:hypothetical protein
MIAKNIRRRDINMGYFSNLAIEYAETYEDNSYPSPDRQLIWRLEDLQSRLEELKENGEPRRYQDDGIRLTDDDIRYAIPEYFVRIVDVERAIDLAISDLQLKYNIVPAEEYIDEGQSICDVQPPEQLYFDEFLIVEPYDKSLKAA